MDLGRGCCQTASLSSLPCGSGPPASSPLKLEVDNSGYPGYNFPWAVGCTRLTQRPGRGSVFPLNFFLLGLIRTNLVCSLSHPLLPHLFRVLPSLVPPPLLLPSFLLPPLSPPNPFTISKWGSCKLKTESPEPWGASKLSKEVGTWGTCGAVSEKAKPCFPRLWLS